MGIINFDGKTFVAFVDIAGFKHMMKDKEKIAEVVYHFYNSGYNILYEFRSRQANESPDIQGIFVSDCGIIFVNKDHENFETYPIELQESLNLLLNDVKKLNIQMIDINVMLTTSIAYGSLNCSDKLEFRGISKNPFYGDAYLNTYIDQEDRQLKIQPGECRIIKKNLPEGIITEESRRSFQNFKILKYKTDDKLHCYFYWMVEDKSKIAKFNKNYSKLENEKYRNMIELIKRSINL